MVGPKRDWLSEKVRLQCVATSEMLERSWVAKMLWKDNGLGKSVCGQRKTATSAGCSLIHEVWVLTAAHCFRRSVR